MERACSPEDPTTHGQPDGTAESLDAKGASGPDQLVAPSACVEEARWLEVSVIRVVRPHATNKELDPRISWFVWLRETSRPILAEIALGYADPRRFGQEHGYRFDKQALLWEKPRLRTPKQFGERWSQ